MDHGKVETVLQFAALLLTVSAAFAYVNSRWLKMPHAIGMVVMALAGSLVILGLDVVVPALGLREIARGILGAFEFPQTLMHGMLSFLLFAGALNVDLSRLAERKWSVLLLATVGVLISTALVGGGMYAIFRLLGLDVPLGICIVFGALISPTDPLAVLGILRRMDLPETMVTQITGESLFNDGVAIVVFIIALEAVTGGQGGPDLPEAVGLFLGEALGGIALGLATGYLAFALMRTIDKYDVEILITLALVTATYGLALKLHISGPIAVVVAGLLIGNHGARLAMSETTRNNLYNFWTVLDEILNTLLFVMIGFEILAVETRPSFLVAGLAAIVLVLAARAISLGIPLFAFGLLRNRPQGTVVLLTWGGLRGGISVALALSLPAAALHDIILTSTYLVVIFSILVQGLTLERVAARLRSCRDRPDRA